MEGKDTEQVSAALGREDDRNELEEGSPIPNPENEHPGDDDIPGAD
jgi:hypothetical protein